MTYDPERHHRHSIRLPGYDYTQAGAYFVTLVTHQRECLFGEIVDGEMLLNEIGRIVRDEWFRSAEIRREIVLDPDEFVVMPNHIHGIVWICDIEDDVGADGVGADGVGAHGVGAHGVGAHGRAPLPGQRLPRSLSSFIAGFKSAVTKRINEYRGTPGVPVWQRNYFEHIIRDDGELERIRRYIMNNPALWKEDRENLDVITFARWRR
ncbi:hypothetical protein HRbin16_01901 [bacterium HR16]|nr:hypothetical protein HRbin16_01901 [bacterium HR16]